MQQLYNKNSNNVIKSPIQNAFWPADIVAMSRAPSSANCPRCAVRIILSVLLPALQIRIQYFDN